MPLTRGKRGNKYATPFLRSRGIGVKKKENANLPPLTNGGKRLGGSVGRRQHRPLSPLGLTNGGLHFSSTQRKEKKKRKGLAPRLFLPRSSKEDRGKQKKSAEVGSRRIIQDLSGAGKKKVI